MLLLTLLTLFALLASAHPVYAQDKPESLGSVSVTSLRDPVDKSYRRMIRGMDVFEQRHHLAPDASLRFKLLPRKRDTDMEHIDLRIVGDSFVTPVELAPDRTFTLERDVRALQEDASVRPNRKAGSMTWRAEIRTPGLPPDARRLGDLRLECEVGVEARLISNRRRSLFAWLDDALTRGSRYCHDREPRYLFFADRPLFGATLVAGERRQTIPVDRLYAGASRDPEWKDDLRYCDCEVLLDRTYFLPLGDRSWPDDTLIQFDYMDGESIADAEPPFTADAAEPLPQRYAQPQWAPRQQDAPLRIGEIASVRAAANALAAGVGKSSKAEIRAALGPAIVVEFESGYEVWVYKEPMRERGMPPPRELVLLFSSSRGLSRIRVN
jgi:hypothetical protein